MDTETLANQAGGDDTSSDTDATQTGADTEVQQEPQLDDDGNPIEEEPEDVEEEEEVDLDGLKLKLPKSQAEQLRQAALRQADYTRKTQALAEANKAFEAERATYQQASQQEQSVRVNIAILDNQIAHFSKVDWNAFHDADPFEAQKQFAQFQLAENARQRAGQYLGHLTQERTSKEQQADAEARQAYARLLEQGSPAIKAQIPDWNPAKATTLFQDAMKGYGFTREEMTGVDERIILALNDALQWRSHQAKAKKAQSIQKQQEVVPANPVRRASAPPQGLADSLSAEEWMRRRNAQVKAGA